MEHGVFEYPFRNVRQVSIPGTLHGFDLTHTDIEIVECTLDGTLEVAVVGSTRNESADNLLLLHPVTHDIVIVFRIPQTGRVILRPSAEIQAESAADTAMSP